MQYEKYDMTAHDEVIEEPHWKPTGGNVDRSRPRNAPEFSATPDYRKPEKKY